LTTLAAGATQWEGITKIEMGFVDGETFERLVFSLIGSAPGYENPEWLIHTNAPDRGRDLSVFDISDSLSGTMRAAS